MEVDLDQLFAGLEEDEPSSGQAAPAEQLHPLRSPCKACGGTEGRLREKGAQDCIYCRCGAYQYNAPRKETGKPVRHVKTREALKPALRARVLCRDSARCVLCGVDDQPLHAGHLLSLDQGKQLGLTEDELNVEENLATMCDACNLGLSKAPIPLRLWAKLLMKRQA